MNTPKSVVSILYTLAIFIFGNTLISCKGSQDPLPQKSNSLTPDKIDIETADFDPYFIESTVIHSTQGPASIVRNTMEDKNGHIWLATWEGIMKYDGKEFTNFTNKHNLRRYHVFGAMEDHKGDLWFTTIGAGIYHYDGTAFTNYTTGDGLPNDRVTVIYEDQSGIIWIGTESGLCRYDGQSFKSYTMADGLPSDDINAIVQDESGTYWIGARGNACTFDGNSFTLLTKDDGLPFHNVRDITIDSGNHLWLGGNDGLWRYDGEQFTQYTSVFTGYIYEDSQQQLWTSTPGGEGDNWVLTKYSRLMPGNIIEQSEVLHPKIGMLFGINEDNSGSLWVGGIYGVCRFDRQEFHYY